VNCEGLQKQKKLSREKRIQPLFDEGIEGTAKAGALAQGGHQHGEMGRNTGDRLKKSASMTKRPRGRKRKEGNAQTIVSYAPGNSWVNLDWGESESQQRIDTRRGKTKQWCLQGQQTDRRKSPGRGKVKWGGEAKREDFAQSPFHPNCSRESGNINGTYRNKEGKTEKKKKKKKKKEKKKKRKKKKKKKKKKKGKIKRGKKEKKMYPSYNHDSRKRMG